MAGIKKILFGDPEAEGAVKSNLRASKDLYGRVAKLFDIYMAKVKGAEEGGAYNPETQIGLSEAQSDYDKGVADRADAGTARILGYRPGDTTPITQLRGRSEAFGLARSLNRFQIRQGSLQNMLGAYSGAPSGAALGAGQGMGQNAQGWLQAGGDPTAFWNAAMQWYAKRQGA